MTEMLPAKSQRSLLALLGFVLLCYGIAAVGGLSTTPNIKTWYATINRPPWTPPNWLFGPVWTVLYGTLAVALWRVYRQPKGPERRLTLIWFGGHLVLNALWSPVFFAAHLPWPALGIILAMIASLLVMMAMMRRFDKTAVWLLVPYLLWISYASSLNAGIAVLN